MIENAHLGSKVVFRTRLNQTGAKLTFDPQLALRPRWRLDQAQHGPFWCTTPPKKRLGFVLKRDLSHASHYTRESGRTVLADHPDEKKIGFDS